MSFASPRSLLLALVFLLPVPSYAAPPVVTSLFPAGAQRGTTVTITAAGTFERWPVQAWTDSKGITVKAGAGKGKLTVALAPDVLPGTHWLRLYDEEGASSPRPFIVGTLAELLEVEPNDDPKKPQVIDSTMVTINGLLEKAGDVDCFALKLRKGQTLVAALEANRTLASPMDGVLQVVSADGFVLDQNHDFHGLDPQIVFSVPADGTYLVRTFAFPATPDTTIRFAGGPNYIYRLTLTTGPFLDHAFPAAIARTAPAPVALFGWNLPDALKQLAATAGEDADFALLAHPLLGNTLPVRLEPHSTAVEKEPNDAVQPQLITLPLTIAGRIDPPGDVDVFAFAAKKAQPLLFQAEARQLGSPFTPVLRVTDVADKLLARAEGTDAKPDPDLIFTAPLDGTYRLHLRDLHETGSWRHVYRLRATMDTEFELSVAADRFAIMPGQVLTIPVTVEKRPGMAREVELAAVDLPPGITLDKGSAKGVGKLVVGLAVHAKPDALSGALRIEGRIVGQPEARRSAYFSVPELKVQSPYLWLNVPKPKNR